VEPLRRGMSGTEVIGMLPDPLVLPAVEGRLRLLDTGPARLLSLRPESRLARRVGRVERDSPHAIADAGPGVPPEVAEATGRLSETSTSTSSQGPQG